MDHIKSLLFVPAEDKRLAKIGQTNADAYIVDLEDSIDETQKEEALNRTIKFLERCDKNNIFVRVNRFLHMHELEELSKFPVGIVLPKIQEYEDYADVEHVLKDRNVVALIESPKALMNANSIAAISWINALAFGAEDFTVAMGMLNSYDNLVVPKSLLAISAKANGKKVYDTPCFQLKNERVMEEELTQAVNLGFDGKLAIHPKQVDYINRAFCLQDLDYLRHVVNVFEDSGLAVCEIDGKIYEQLHIKQIKEQLLRKS